MTEIAICDETPFGFGWIASEPARLERASHALCAEGRVWLVDPVDGPGLVERVAALGEPAGVLQLLDRHPRDAEALARRLGVPYLRLPFAGIPGSPFEVRPVLNLPGWRELALWWPAERVLVCTEALGTVPYFLAPGERLGVHPSFRLLKPRSLRALAGLPAAHVLVGHGRGIHGEEAGEALDAAVRGARRRAPAWLWHRLGGRRRFSR